MPRGGGANGELGTLGTEGMLEQTTSFGGLPWRGAQTTAGRREPCGHADGGGDGTDTVPGQKLGC